MIETSVFGTTYAGQYDLFYKEKDYEAECDFLETIFQGFATTSVKSILDLGCGTGGHAIPLARRGYHVTGVDRSEDMLAEAYRKNTNCNHLQFYLGDIRNIALEQTFDAVVAMFAVIGYMTSNEDLNAAFRTARKHLRPGGLFIFDVWFGPAVVNEHPSDRYKIVNNNGERVIRLVHPELNLLSQTVNVNYKVLRLQGPHLVEEVDEGHNMRFLFPNEITYHLKQTEFSCQSITPFMQVNRIPTERDWNIAVVAVAQ